MNIFVKILYLLFGTEKDEFVDDNVYVYTDAEDENLVKEGTPMGDIRKSELLARFKRIHKKRKISKVLFGIVFYERIYIVEINKIPFQNLKDRFVRYKNKQQVFLDEAEDKISLRFESTTCKPKPLNPYI